MSPRHPGGPTLRIGIDYRPALDGRGGIAVYARELVAALAATFPADELELYAHRLRRPEGKAEPSLPQNAHLRRRRVPAQALALAARAGLGVDRVLGSVDVVHATDYVHLGSSRAPLVATIHDVCFADFPECYTQGQRRRLGSVVARLTREAARLIVPSERVLADLERHFGVPLARVAVVPHGCRPLPDGPPVADLGPYVLFVGTLQPRKNLERLLTAFDAVHEVHPDVRLVLAGPRGWMADGVLLGIQQRAHVLHEADVAAARLGALYRGALAVAMPSLGEGFGLPVLEAMQCGRAVLVGAGTACSDLAGDAGLAVEATDVAAVAEGLRALVDDDALRARLGARGQERAAAYTWERAARATRAVYAEAIRS